MGFLDELKRLTHPYEDEMEDEYDEDDNVYEDDEPEAAAPPPPPREEVFYWAKSPASPSKVTVTAVSPVCVNCRSRFRILASCSRISRG